MSGDTGMVGGKKEGMPEMKSFMTPLNGLTPPTLYEAFRRGVTMARDQGQNVDGFDMRNFRRSKTFRRDEK